MPKKFVFEEAMQRLEEIVSLLEKGDCVEVEFFQDGHIIHLCGKSRIDIYSQKLFVGAFEINFDDIHKIKAAMY